VWKFSSVDMCELARNSVLMSGFPHQVCMTISLYTAAATTTTTTTTTNSNEGHQNRANIVTRAQLSCC